MQANDKSFSVPDVTSPTSTITPQEPGPKPGVALCLSGGGFRAMVFHTGVLRRLNDGGYLQTIDRVSSVSGGSIAAGTLALNWSKLSFNTQGVATNFDDVIVKPIRTLAAHTIDVGSVVSGVFGFGTVVD